MGIQLTKSWTDIKDIVLQPGKAITSTMLFAFRDNLMVVMQALGGSYLANFTFDHIHDGIGSALIETGPNLIRNGSFESGEDGWTVTDYTGGSHAVTTTQNMHGSKGLSFTSTALASGGGNALSDSYIACGTGMELLILVLAKASVAGVSAKLQVIWYDTNQAQISTTDFFTTASLSTAAFLFGGKAVPPANARFARLNLIGGIPNSGTAVGTVTFDGVWFSTRPKEMSAAGADYVLPVTAGNQLAFAQIGESTSPVERANYRLTTSGWKRFYFELVGGGTVGTAYAQIYRNGVSYGVVHSAPPTNPTVFTEDLYFDENDTMQIFIWDNLAGQYPSFGNVKSGVDKTVSLQWPQMVVIGIGVR